MSDDDNGIFYTPKTETGELVVLLEILTIFWIVLAAVIALL